MRWLKLLPCYQWGRRNIEAVVFIDKPLMLSHGYHVNPIFRTLKSNIWGNSKTYGNSFGYWIRFSGHNNLKTRARNKYIRFYIFAKMLAKIFSWKLPRFWWKLAEIWKNWWFSINLALESFCQLFSHNFALKIYSIVLTATLKTFHKSETFRGNENFCRIYWVPLLNR
jgi:hypothetical protein